MKKWMSAVAALALVGVLAGCSSSGGDVTEVELVTPGMEFAQKEIALNKNQPYKIVLKNTDSVEHDIVIKGIPAKAVKTGTKAHGHGGSKDPVFAHAEANGTDWVSFTPTRDGAYEFYCTIPGHKDAGMIGTIIVQ